MGNKLLMTIKNRFCKTKNSVCKIFTQIYFSRNFLEIFYKQTKFLKKTLVKFENAQKNIELIFLQLAIVYSIIFVYNKQCYIT